MLLQAFLRMSEPRNTSTRDLPATSTCKCRRALGFGDAPRSNGRSDVFGEGIQCNRDALASISAANGRGKHALAGSTVSSPAMSFALITRGGKPRLAPTAGAPGCAAAANPADAATTSTAAGAATATTATAAATTTTTSPATSGELNVAVLCRSGTFLVEDVERRQADVSDFFFAERDLLIG